MARLNRQDWVAGISFVSYGLRIGIRCNQAGVLQQLEPHLPPGWRPARTPYVEHLYSLWLDGDSRSGGATPSHQLYTGSLLLAQADRREKLFDPLESHLQLYVAEWARRRIFVHAGVVGWRGRAILVPGRSFSGKTALVAAFVRAGATYYSDEYAVLDAKGRVHPYPRRLAIRGEGGRGARRCSAAELGGRTGCRSLPVGLVLVTRFREGARWRGVALAPPQGALALLSNTVPARRRPATVLAALQEVVRDAQLLKGVRGEATEMVEELMPLLTW
jgi:hypothetical protein